MDKIYYGKQLIDKADIDEVVKILKSDFLTTGPTVEEFENELSSYIGTRYSVVFSSGTAALHAAYYVAGLEEGDEIITSPITFIATANAAVYLGAKVNFIDIDSKNYCMDISKLKEMMNEKIKVVTPVSFGGYPVNIKKIRESVGEDVVIVEDAAHSLGAVRDGIKVGVEADMTMFSFHPIKHITTGEGGAIVTNSKKYYEKLKKFRNHGVVMSNDEYRPWHYDMVEIGYNYRMTDIQAALGISQLKKLDYFLEKRRELAEIYIEEFKNVEGVEVLSKVEGIENGYHLFPVLVKNRDRVYLEMKKQGIICQVNYIPVYKHSFYKKRFDHIDDNFKVAEDFYKKELSLPLYPSLGVEKARFIVKKLIEIIGEM